MAKVLDVANYIINALPVNNLKLQKLLYYSQVVHLVLNDKQPLFEDKIEAWDYGPVVSSIYKKFKNFGWDNIQANLNFKNNLTNNEMKSVDLVLGYYGSMDPFVLVNKTHQESPWKDVYQPQKNNEITTDSMYEFYKDFYDFE